MTPPHDERAHFLAKHRTHVVCCSLREGHRIVGNDRLAESEAEAKAAEWSKRSGGKIRYWTEKAIVLNCKRPKRK